jgi:uncharacterized membrane protein
LLAYDIKIFDKKSRTARLIIFLIKIFFISIVSIWILGFLQPILFNQQDSISNYIFKRIYSPVCHQVHDKCISIENNEMLVCARCFGIYSGSLIAGIAIIFFQFANMKIKLLLIAPIPLIADVMLSTIDIYSYSKLLAFITGLIFGTIVFLFLLNEIENLFLIKSIKRNE